MISQDKNETRKAALAERDALDETLRAELSDKIWAQLCLLEAFGSAYTVLFYASFRSEVETYEMMMASLRMGKRVGLPKIDRATRKFDLYSIKDCETLEAGAYGILEPPEDGQRAIRFSEVDLILVPGAAFDAQGNRVGYGQGYYDCFLNHPEVKAMKAGLAFSFQMREKVPADKLDVPVDWVVTETGIITCAKK